MEIEKRLISVDYIMPNNSKSKVDFKSFSDFSRILIEPEEDDFLVIYECDGICYYLSETTICTFPYREEDYA